MLIGKSGYPQAICLRALGNARPIHMHRDVGMPDLLEWRIKTSMARADLNVSQKFGARPPVIDRDHVTTLQMRCDALAPVKRRLVKPHVLIERPLNRHNVVPMHIAQTS